MSLYIKYKGSEKMPRKGIYYNKTNTCDRCKEKLVIGKVRREYNENRDWTGNWLCNKCYLKDYHKKPNSRNNIIKSIANHRTGNLDPNCTLAKGDKFEELTCRWRSTVSTVPVENLNIKNDNYSTGTPIDHSRDSELGIPQTRGKLYDSYNRFWVFGGLEREWFKEFDVIICYCTNKDGKIIERIYIIPKKEIKDKRTCISIYKNPTDSHGDHKTSWYDKYRIIDEETIKKVNDIWKKIIEEDRKVEIIICH
jgi:hypothetical protein